MKVVHCCWMSPNRCGLYATTKDLIKAERLVGVDAQMLNTTVKDGKIEIKIAEDGWLKTISLEEAKTADIFVHHTAIPKELKELHIPIISALHGRPESSMLLSYGTNKLHHAYYNHLCNPDYKAFVSFWKDYGFELGLDYPSSKLRFVDAPVDLDKFHPEGPKFDFGNSSGNPNIVVADIWREDITPYNTIMACAKFIKEYCPTGRLHIFGMDKPIHGATLKLIKSLQRAGILGKWCGLYPDMPSVFRAADFVVTPHIIATRIVREAMACGCPVLGAQGNKWTFGTLSNPNNVDGSAKQIVCWWETVQNGEIKQFRKNVRIDAVLDFGLEKTGNQMKEIFEEVMKHISPMGCRKISSSVFLDIGGHLGETIRKFYSDIAYADEWDIYTFEPNPECMEKMKQLSTKYSNVEYASKALADYTSKGILQIGEVNNADGSTIVDGKLTGKLTSKKEVEVIDFSEWFESNKIGDYKKVIVKLNVEGGEYPILKSIIRSGVLKDIDILLVNTHSHKFREPEKSKFEQLEKEFLEYSKGFNCKVVFKKQGEFDYNAYE